jgi:hypothetical protein
VDARTAPGPFVAGTYSCYYADDDSDDETSLVIVIIHDDYYDRPRP